jgi:hypothetical protein
MVRHVNPWNDPNIKPHSYAAYEDEFRQFMADADIPLEKELPTEPEPEPEPAALKKLLQLTLLPKLQLRRNNDYGRHKSRSNER